VLRTAIRRVTAPDLLAPTVELAPQDGRVDPALLTEVVFGLQGIGKLTYDALRSLDLPVIMATVMYASFFVVIANAAVDLLYVVLDPRIRKA